MSLRLIENWLGAVISSSDSSHQNKPSTDETLMSDRGRLVVNVEDDFFINQDLQPFVLECVPPPSDSHREVVLRVCCMRRKRHMVF